MKWLGKLLNWFKAWFWPEPKQIEIHGTDLRFYGSYRDLTSYQSRKYPKWVVVAGKGKLSYQHTCWEDPMCNYYLNGSGKMEMVQGRLFKESLFTWHLRVTCHTCEEIAYFEPFRGPKKLTVLGSMNGGRHAS